MVSAGGTREHLDPVRFLGNPSSGRMGWALARAAVLRGAEVHLVAANVTLPAPPGHDVDPVTSTGDLADGDDGAAPSADLVVMAAAPADFTPAARSDTKIKKAGDGGLHVDLVQTTDVLAALVAARTDPRQVLVGFAAETPTPGQSLLELGRAKLARKGCDLLVLNEVGERQGVRSAGQRDRPADRRRGRRTARRQQGLLAHDIWDCALRRRSHR